MRTPPEDQRMYLSRWKRSRNVLPAARTSKSPISAMLSTPTGGISVITQQGLAKGRINAMICSTTLSLLAMMNNTQKFKPF